MEHPVGMGGFHAGAQDALTVERSSGALRCDICRRRLGHMIAFLEETGDVPEPRRSWALCHDCNQAVHRQLQRSPIQSPARLRVAVGLVASERTPEARRAQMGQISDAAWMKLFFWLFLITMLVHLAVIVAIAGIIK